MNVTCIVCPRSCRITVERQGDGYLVSGNSCPRGKAHAISELSCPMRMLTTTVSISGASLPRLPVISSAPVPKRDLARCLELTNRLRLAAPVREGEVLLSDLAGTGVDIIAAKSMKAVSVG